MSKIDGEIERNSEAKESEKQRDSENLKISKT